MAIRFLDEEVVSQQVQEQAQSKPKITFVDRATVSSGNKNSDKFLPGLEKTEALMSNRNNMIRDLIKDPSTLERFKKHPVGTSLRTIGGAFDYLEGVPSSIAIDLQKGKPKDILSNLMKVATGERVPQRGDILRNIGTDELLASSAGLLAGGVKISPETALGKMIFNNPVVDKFTKVIATHGADALAKAVSVVGGIPKEKALQAIKNPNFLDKNWIAKKLGIAQKQYKAVVQPIIDDNTNRVNTSSLKNISEDIGVIQKNGDFTKSFESMNAREQRFFLKIENKIHGNNLSFNDVDSLIGQIDESLSAVYKSKDAGKAVDYSDDFVRNITKMRNSLNDLRKRQYPQIAQVLDDYQTVKTAKNVYSHFDRWLPHFLPAITANAGAALVGGVHNPAIFGVATLGAIPKLQAGAIKLGSQASITDGMIGKNLGLQGVQSQLIKKVLTGQDY